MKSEVDSLTELAEDQKPTIFCLVETHLENEEVAILGWETIYRNDKTANNGGILVAIKDNIKAMTMRIHKKDQVGQGLWILIENKNTRLKLGVIYTPQENTTPNKELKKMYGEKKNQIEQTRQQCQNIIIVEDFNAKIGKRIKGNKERVTKGGRQIIKLSNIQGMVENTTPLP